MSTPAFSYVLRLDFMWCAEKVSQLLNRPVMSLFGTRMSGTSTEVVSHRIQLKLPATEGILSNVVVVWCTQGLEFLVTFLRENRNRVKMA
jgi:hypothetical protein